MSDEIFTVDEAAQFLKVAPDVVAGLLETNEVAGRRIGGEWRTTKRALVSYVDGVPLQVACCPPGCCSPEEMAAAGVNCCTPDGGNCC